MLWIIPFFLALAVVVAAVTVSLKLLLGKYNILHKKENAENFRRLCQRQTDVLREKIKGLEKGGYSAEKERALYQAIEKELLDL